MQFSPMKKSGLAFVHMAQSVRFFLRRYPRRSLLLIATTFVAAVSESLGLVALLPLFQQIMGGGIDATSNVSQFMYFGYEMLHIPPTLAVVLASIFLFIFFRAVLMFTAYRHVSNVMADMQTELRRNLFRALLKARWSFFTSQQLGPVINAVSFEAPSASVAYGATIDLIASALQAMLLVVAAFFIRPEIAGASLLAGLCMAWVLSSFVKLARNASVRDATHMRALTARLADALQGIKSIKTMNAERFFMPILERENAEICQAARQSQIAKSGVSVFHEPIIALFIVIGMYVILEVAHINLPDLLAMTVLFYRTSRSINLVQARGQLLLASEVYYRNIVELTQKAETAEENLTASQLGVGSQKPANFSGKIRFEDVEFKYHQETVLHNLSLDIPYGSFTAIYGPSGSGKTTLLELLCGLYQPQQGRIYIDQDPLNHVDLGSWRQQIGYVPQDIFLFHDSVLNNLTLGDPQITEEQVVRALKQAEAFDFVANLKGGVNAVIGERGLTLSGGQRQRLVIARALVRNPRLLILDEATNALDVDTEREILATLKKLSGGITILAVSHQPAVVDAADHKIGLFKGKIEATGNLRLAN